jgi:hypothetical protein
MRERRPASTAKMCNTVAVLASIYMSISSYNSVNGVT